jgi:DNA-binding transcriptional MerR regulator
VRENDRALTKPLTTKDLADAGGVAPATIRRMARKGLLRFATDFRGWRKFAPSEVARVRQLLGWSILDEGARD